ncbi:S8 family peptidase [Deinococcus planocerae]|uniref:S8 family peptidase n=1 Tax=Deinococcus planocerae TaxID=1737569 RepID=UPI000C7ED9D1|nr:S8 family serine peptidase [Deinococcus planocerae]
MKPSKMLQTALGLCTAALIVGCNQSSTAPTAQAESKRPEYVMSVPVTAGDTPQTLEARYGGRVVEFNAEAGVAIMGTGDGQTQALNMQALSLSGVRAEPNRKQFRGGGVAMMSGSRSMWAGGSRSMWAGGSRSMWAGGVYASVAENTVSFQQVKLERAHALAPNLGAGVKVAVIDTGLDLGHAAFAGSLAPVTEWKDYVGGDAVPQEEGTLGVGGYGHGTAVASIVLQVAPLATILPIRVLDSDGAGDTDHVASAIYYAAEQGARVINLSLGSVTRSDVIEQAVKYVTEKKNILVVSSAGNENTNAITYPAAHAFDGADGDRSLSVGSVNARDLKSSFSNYQKDKLELMAPGENIFAAGPGGLLVSWSGTSMAAPIVTGGLALALGQTLSVGLKDVTKKMTENGQDLYTGGLNSAYKDMLGKGRLNLERFLTNAVKY